MTDRSQLQEISKKQIDVDHTREGIGQKSELQWKLQQLSDIQPATLPNPPQVIYSGVNVLGAREALFAAHDFC
jgi:hypothetical protein